MRRKLLLLIAMFLIAGLITTPYKGQALSELEKINKDLKKNQEEMEQAQHKQRYATNSIKELTGKKVATKEDLDAVLGRIEEIQHKLDATLVEITVSEEKLLTTGKELDEAISQLNNRKELMDSRVRMAYVAGPVSYLDVLISSASFSDFLVRLDVVESITTQDRNIAYEKEKYSQAVAEKKVQREIDLKKVKELYVQLEAQRANLHQEELDKEVLLANIDKQISHMEEISDEAEQQLTELIKQASALEAKKNRIKNYYKGGKLGVPLKGDYRVSSEFGYRDHPVTGKRKLHGGLDMAAPKGTPVYAAESGVVTIAQSTNGYGNTIAIDHGGSLLTLYGHLSAILVKRGETVKRGEKIGLVGNTGISTGNHLHFEVRKDLVQVNPAPYLK